MTKNKPQPSKYEEPALEIDFANTRLFIIGAFFTLSQFGAFVVMNQPRIVPDPTIQTIAVIMLSVFVGFLNIAWIAGLIQEIVDQVKN